MNNLKDNNQNDGNKGHVKHGAIENNANQNISSIDIIVRKAEKLTTALYMVSDIIADREPIKWKVRETSVELLSDITLSGTSTSFDRLNFLRGVIKKIEKIVSFLDIAMVTRMVSEMNASLLRQEYIALRDMIENDVSDLLGGKGFKQAPPPPMYRIQRKQEVSLKDEGALVSDTLQENLRVLDSRPTHDAERSGVKEQVAGGSLSERDRRQVEPSGGREFGATNVETNTQNFRAQSSFNIASTNLRSEVSTRSANQPVRPATQTPPQPMTMPRETRVFPVNSSTATSDSRIAKDDRRKIILALLKQRSGLTVKDIAKSIPGFSEKTIQRELVAMLEDSLLIKNGEKRWTTYSLAQGQ